MLNILLITDNKAGHESVSKGLIEYIRTKYDVNIIEVEAKIRAKFIKKIATIVVNNFKLTKKNIEFFTKLFYKNCSLCINQRIDLIVSTGGDTSFLNILFAKYLSSPNIYCSSLRGLKARNFTYFLSLENKQRYPNEIILDLPPIFVELSKKELEGEFISFLIGGRTGIYRFDTVEIIEAVKNIMELARKFNYKILVTTSRRTSKEVEERLEKICKENSDIFHKYVLFNKKPEKIMKFFLSNSKFIFCTEDSGSMITEAILAKKKLYTIKPKEVINSKLYDNFMKIIIDKGYAKSYKISDLSKITFKEEFKTIEKLPTEIVYDKIKHLLKDKR